MDAPDLLRFTALDPLGRTLYLAVADGRKFALIDNRAASVQRGLVNGRVWRELVPEPLKVQDVVALLADQLERVPAFGIRTKQKLFRRPVEYPLLLFRVTMLFLFCPIIFPGYER